jgi:hypothetical protein
MISRSLKRASYKRAGFQKEIIFSKNREGSCTGFKMPVYLQPLSAKEHNKRFNFLNRLCFFKPGKMVR